MGSVRAALWTKRGIMVSSVNGGEIMYRRGGVKMHHGPRR